MSERDRKEFLWMLFLIGLVMLALAVMANATTLARLQFDELVTTANAIARVHCLRAETHWKSGEIWTRTDFLVVATNKGSLPRIVEVEMPEVSLAICTRGWKKSRPSRRGRRPISFYGFRPTAHFES